MTKFILTIIAAFAGTISFGQTKISVDSAGAYVGKEVMVCSKVFEVRTFGQLTLLRLGAAYPKSPLTVAVAKDSATFTISPEDYKDKVICVTGIVKMYKGKPEITVSKQEQIQFDVLK